MKNKLSIISLILFLVFLSIGTISAEDPYKDFKSYLENKFLNPFTKDLGGVIGGGSFHQGSVLGFPGFDIGVHIPVKKVSGDNIIVSTVTQYLALPWVQVEIGLPAKINLLARGFSYKEVNLLGAGLRWGLVKLPLEILAASVMGCYNQMRYTDFTAVNYNLNVIGSLNIPMFSPYFGLGYDWTELTLSEQLQKDVGDIRGKAEGYRIEAGINFSVIPFTYLHISAGLTNNDIAYNFGFGTKF